MRRALRDVDLLINAAGPFALTAERLAKDALDAGCHYVDINGEIDVYKKLDDLGRYAMQRGRAMVSSAGHTAAASDLLLEAALRALAARTDLDCGRDLGAVRIAMSRIMTLSRGSAETVWRSLREQVTVVRTWRRRSQPPSRARSCGTSRLASSSGHSTSVSTAATTRRATQNGISVSRPRPIWSTR